MIQYRATPTAEVTASEQAHSDFIRQIAGECMVLLENDGTLPLKNPGKVALYGNGARATVKGGTGSGDATSDYDDIKFVVVDSGHINVNVFTRLDFVSKHKGSKLFSLRKRRMAFFGRNFNIF